MKRILFVGAMVLIATSFCLAQDGKLQAQLIQMDKDWTAAELKGDAKAVGMFIADDFWATAPDGSMQNRAQYMADVKPSKDTDMADEYAIRFYGKDMAVMTHRGTVKGERSFQYRSTHVWVNKNGRWQIVAHHSSEVAPATSAKPADGAKTAPAMKPAPAAKPKPTSTSDTVD